MTVGVRLLENTIQEYAWGSRTAIAELTGAASPARAPQAELWMGAHPKAPSRVVMDGRSERLDELVRRAPEAILGGRVLRRFGPALPFLYKVLAAGEPLSIQAHPTLDQAREGFARENARGLPLDAPTRSYRDDNHKPEILAALTPMWALYGFRAVPEAVAFLRRTGVPGLEPLALLLEREGLRAFYSTLLGLGAEERRALVDAAVSQAPGRIGEAEAEWMQRLASRYPGDPGVLAPLYLNLVRVAPGEAVYLAAGELHAYLDGTGVELMANSDNVLRGGLTPKHVDVPELLATLTFRGEARTPFAPRRESSGEERYDTPAAEFALSRIALGPEGAFRCAAEPEGRAVEILLVTEGSATVRWAEGRSLPVRRGQSCLVAADAGAYELRGPGTVYRATVP